MGCGKKGSSSKRARKHFNFFPSLFARVIVEAAAPTRPSRTVDRVTSVSGLAEETLRISTRLRSRLWLADHKHGGVKSCGVLMFTELRFARTPRLKGARGRRECFWAIDN